MPFDFVRPQQLKFRFCFLNKKQVVRIGRLCVRKWKKIKRPALSDQYRSCTIGRGSPSEFRPVVRSGPHRYRSSQFVLISPKITFVLSKSKASTRNNKIDLLINSRFYDRPMPCDVRKNQPAKFVSCGQIVTRVFVFVRSLFLICTCNPTFALV